MRHSHDGGKKRFRNLISARTAIAPPLPLVHNSDSYILQDILEDGKIHPQDCNVFDGEALTYLFYGRPAFRPNLDAEPTGLKHYFPVCFIFKPDWKTNIKRLFPFDTGAFHKGFYASYLHKRMKLGDFGLEADMTSAGKIVSMFFGENPDYLLGKSQATPTIDPSEFEAQSYLTMVTAKNSNTLDSRGSSIELQTSESIVISDTVAAVILPSTFADGQTGKALKVLGLDVLTYRGFERYRPTEHMSRITDICLDYYIHLGLVKASDL